MNNLPSITVVIATYNASSTVLKAVLSVLGQDYPYLELLVIDGDSTDNTIDLLVRLDDSRFRIISEPDEGIYDAWNKAVRIVSSDRILFIGADDELNGTTAISDFWNNVHVDSEHVDLIYGNLVAFGPDGVPAGQVGAKWRDPWGFSGRHIWSNFHMPIMATFFDRNAIVKAGYFDSNLRIMADINLVLTIARNSSPLYMGGRPVTLMGFGGISTRPGAGALAMREAIDVRHRHRLGSFSNAEFLLRSALWQFKYLIEKYLGQDAAIKVVNMILYLKKLMR